MSTVCYLIPVWGAATKSLRKKVQTLMNRAARYVTGWDRRTRTIKLMGECRWLLIDELIDYQSLVAMWTILNRQIPREISDEIKMEDDGTVSVTAARLKLVARGFKWRTTKVWNELELGTRTERSLPKFKSKIKNWIRSRRIPAPVPDG